MRWEEIQRSRSRRVTQGMGLGRGTGRENLRTLLWGVRPRSPLTGVAGNTRLARTAPALRRLWSAGRQSSCETRTSIDGAVKLGETWLFCLRWAERGAETRCPASRGGPRRRSAVTLSTGGCQEESAAREPFFTSLMKALQLCVASACACLAAPCGGLRVPIYPRSRNFFML